VTAEGAYWKWIIHGGMRLEDIGINLDGSLHNPNNYDERVLLGAIATAELRRRQRASDGSRKANDTKRKRAENT